jgi:putative Ca2+/H+ antiporter (TMEM165/GDT1 family)
VNVPLILVFEVVAGAVVAGVASAVAAGEVVAAAVAPELLLATGLALFVAAAVALVVALAPAVEDDDEADALDVAPGPVTGPPAMFIALVVPN